MQKVFYGQVLRIIFPCLSETEKETDTVALMTAWGIPGCHPDKKLYVEQLQKNEDKVF